MTMALNGRAKLIEEVGELLQVCGKLLAYPEGAHPDGGPPLHDRLRDELADVLAAARFVADTHFGNDADFWERVKSKIARFEAWHADEKA